MDTGESEDAFRLATLYGGCFACPPTISSVSFAKGTPVLNGWVPACWAGP
jgi:hypothetical protein